MSIDVRYKAFADSLSYDLFVKVYDPLRRKLRGAPPLADEGTLFVHLPKNAGSSLFEALGVPNVGHRLFCDIPKQEKALAKRIVFCTRDPFDRIVSAYRYQQGLVRTKSGLRRANMLGDLGPFSDFVLSERLERLAAHHYFFRSQFRYLQGIERFADRLIHLRFEQLEADVQDRLKITVGRLNSALTEPVETTATPELRARIRSIYRDDYETLPTLLNECGIDLAWKD